MASKDAFVPVNVTAALDVEGNVPLQSVQLDGLVVLKIIKHCRESSPALVTGQLLGLDVSNSLEVTNCFPFPGAKPDDESEQQIDASARYQADMMRCLKEVNVDHNPVGWYQSTYLGSFMTHKLIETQYNYQQTFKNKSVVIVYDVSRSTHGNLSLRAFRFTQAFMDVQKEGKFTMESLLKQRLTFSNIFEELPITIKNSHLITALLHSLDDFSVPQNLDKDLVEGPLTPNFDTLELSLDPYIERNLEFLLETMDDYSQEQGNFAFWQRSVTREQQKVQAWLTKRRQENAAREAAGQDPLPEDEVHKHHKLPPEPSRLDSLLITAQINNYCKQLNQYAGPTLGKLFVVGEFQKK